MSDKHGSVCWNELMTRDVAKAKEYYTETCGWSWDEMPMEEGVYHIAKLGDEMVAGMMDMKDLPIGDEIPAHWLMYLEVSDVDAAAQGTAAMGGVIMRPPWDVPGVGRIALVMDPGGAALGLMTSADGQG